MVTSGSSRLSVRLRLPDSPLDLAFDAPVLSVGRVNNNHVIIPFDVVSRRHCRVELRGTQAFVLDTASTSGTRVNGEQTREAALSPEDAITFGQVTLSVEVVAALAPRDAADPGSHLLAPWMAQAAQGEPQPRALLTDAGRHRGLDHVARLVALLHAQPSHLAWNNLSALFQSWPDPVTLPAALDWTTRVVRHWPTWFRFESWSPDEGQTRLWRRLGLGAPPTHTVTPKRKSRCWNRWT
jgi:predicted component of type VI protein secretion system